MTLTLAVSLSLVLWVARIDAAPQERSIPARIGDHIEAHAAEFIAVHRDLHRHPEVPGAEVRTAASSPGA